jgi:hypothetical protein
MLFEEDPLVSSEAGDTKLINESIAEPLLFYNPKEPVMASPMPE